MIQKLIWILAVLVVVRAIAYTVKIWRAKNRRAQFFGEFINDTGFHFFGAVTSYMLGDHNVTAAFGIAIIFYLVCIYLAWRDKKKSMAAFKN